MSPKQKSKAPQGALLEILDRFSERKILLIGDLVADHYLVGSTSRISREAPVLILKYQEEYTVPGQVGNTAANIAALDGCPNLVSMVGRDTAGKELIESLKQRGVDAREIVQAAGQRTLTKTRLMAGGRHTCRQQVIRVDDDARLRISAAHSEKMMAGFRKLAPLMHAVVVSDYGYGVITDDAWAEISLLARKLKLPLILDSRYSLLKRPGATLATPNEEEALACAPPGMTFDGHTNTDFAPLGKHIRESARLDNLLITRGNEGMELFEGDNPPVTIPIHGTDECTDVTGAGDTVVATTALALASGASPLESAWLANIAGGLVVMKIGTATVSRKEMREAVLAG